MKNLCVKLVFALSLCCFGIVPTANATGPGGGVGGVGGGGVSSQTCWFTYNPCSIGCDSSLICQGQGSCSREKVDSVRDKGVC